MREERSIVSLGSNLGPREETILAAAGRLSLAPGVRVLALSSLYETSPVGVESTRLFVNAACLLAVTLDPRGLLEACLAIEDAFGRRRPAAPERPGTGSRDRTLDIDVLAYGGAIIAEPGLVVPHPRLRERLFVLEPLAEICPDFPLPPDGSLVREIRAALTGEGWARRISARGFV